MDDRARKLALYARSMIPVISDVSPFMASTESSSDLSSKSGENEALNFNLDEVKNAMQSVIDAMGEFIEKTRVKIAIKGDAPVTSDPPDIEKSDDEQETIEYIDSLIIEYAEPSTIKDRQKKILEILKELDPPRPFISKSQLYIIGEFDKYLRDAEPGWRMITDNDIKNINEYLVTFGVYEPISLQHFFTQCSCETGFGKMGTLQPGTSKTRGAGYIQFTSLANYKSFSEFMDDKGTPDPNILEIGAPYVSEHYAWYVSVYHWAVSSAWGGMTYHDRAVAGRSLLEITNYMYLPADVAKNGLNPHPGENYDLKEKLFPLLEGLFDYTKNIIERE